MNLTEFSLSANHCQRNWVPDQVDDNHLTTIVECAKNMPSKQNVDCYTILVSQNQEFNNFCYKNAIHKNSYKKVNRNSQLIAPTLFLWIEPEESNDSWEHFSYVERDIAVGISSGVASFVSNQLGYRTGFCRCFEAETILKNYTSNLEFVQKKYF